MSTESDGGGKSKNKRKASGPLNEFSDEEDENKTYSAYFKQNHIRSYPENSPGTTYTVFLESTEENGNLGNKSPVYLNNIFSRFTKGVKQLKRINASKYAAIFDSPKNANGLLKNTTFLGNHNLRAYIPATNSESVGVVKFVPTELSNKHLFDKLVTSQEILGVRRFTKKTPEGIVPLGTVAITFAGNVLPDYVTYELCALRVEPYIRPVLQCFKCLGI